MYDARFGLGIIVIDIYWHICSTLTQSKHSKYKIQCCSPLSKIQNKVFTSSLKYKLHCCSPPLQNTKSKILFTSPAARKFFAAFASPEACNQDCVIFALGLDLYVFLCILWHLYISMFASPDACNRDWTVAVKFHQSCHCEKPCHVLAANNLAQIQPTFKLNCQLAFFCSSIWAFLLLKALSTHSVCANLGLNVHILLCSLGMRK